MSEKFDQNVTKNDTKKSENYIFSAPIGIIPTTLQQPERDPEWRCYLFGATDVFYTPKKGAVPNWFVRWMMKICFGCRWVKVSKH